MNKELGVEAEVAYIAGEKDFCVYIFFETGRSLFDSMGGEFRSWAEVEAKTQECCVVLGRLQEGAEIVTGVVGGSVMIFPD